jgi:hypothetical protein
VLRRQHHGIDARRTSVVVVLDRDLALGIELVNVRGRAVRRQSVAAGGEAATALVPTAGLPSGLYFVRVLQGGAVAGARVVVLD